MSLMQNIIMVSHVLKPVEEKKKERKRKNQLIIRKTENHVAIILLKMDSWHIEAESINKRRSFLKTHCNMIMMILRRILCWHAVIRWQRKVIRLIFIWQAQSILVSRNSKRY